MGRQTTGPNQSVNVNLDNYPNIDPVLHRPMLANPPLCTLSELQDGTYSLEDLFMMNEILDLKSSLSAKTGKK